MTGNQYRDLSFREKRGYVMGLVDGVFLSPFFGAPKDPKLRAFERCVEGMENDQIVALVDRWLVNHPARWHQGAHVLIYVAFSEACGL